MKKFLAKMVVPFLLSNPDYLVELMEPYLEQPKIRKALQEHGPTVRHFLKAMEEASKPGA